MARPFVKVHASPFGKTTGEAAWDFSHLLNKQKSSRSNSADSAKKFENAKYRIFILKISIYCGILIV